MTEQFQISAEEKEKLLPCPFCGGTNIHYDFWMNGNGDQGPGCMDCDACADSVKAWNTRATPNPAPEVVEALKEARATLEFIEPLIKAAGVPPMARKIGPMRTIGTAGARRIKHALLLIEALKSAGVLK